MAGDSSPRVSQPESEPDGPQVNSRLGPVRAGDTRNKNRFEGYVEHPNLQFEEAEEKVEQRRLRHGVSVLEDGGFRLPCATWSLEEACIPKWMWKLVSPPTPLQAVVWPMLRSNRDVVAIAEHGCGKTLAYAVPLLIRAAALQGATHEQPDWWQQTAWQEWRQRPPDGVILVPTSEIAEQVLQELEPLATAGRVQVAKGDADISAQQKELSRAGVLVLTPWQLQCQSWVLGDEDLTALNQDVLIIFDEADDIIKDGDDEGTQARTILDFMPKNRVLAFFSATWPQRTDEMARRHLRNDTIMVFATSECVSNSKSLYLESRFVVQVFKVMNTLSKQQHLLEALNYVAKRQGKVASVGVFCNKEDTAEQVGNFLRATLANLSVRVAHELMNLSAQDREPEILVATTMLGRGYPFPKIKWLINYDMPASLLEYLCRIRLASRGDGPGFALSFLTPPDLLQANELKVLLENLGQDCPKVVTEAASAGAFHALAERHPDLVQQKSDRRFETPGRAARHRSDPGRFQEKTVMRPLPDPDWKDWKPLTMPGGQARRPAFRATMAPQEADRTQMQRERRLEATNAARVTPSPELPDLISFD